MSELIQAEKKINCLHRNLLTTTSALAFATYLAATSLACADDSDRPTVWVELGGQMDMMQGTTTPFVAGFMSTKPESDFYDPSIFLRDQKAAHNSTGFEGKVEVDSKNSDWSFAAGIRYGRSSAKRHTHYQTFGKTAPIGLEYYHYFTNVTVNAFTDIVQKYSEQHYVIDFSAGRDVGIGLFGRDGTSKVSVGIRLAEVNTSSTTAIYARPNLDVVDVGFDLGSYGRFYLPRPAFNQYSLTGDTTRSFHGIGPSLAWDASATLLGNKDAGELVLDWGINGSLLFGRQKSKVQHNTLATQYTAGTKYGRAHYVGPLYPPRNLHSTRSRSVTVPNVGGFAGFSVQYPNVKVSLGYRADFFFGAVDGGIDVHSYKDLGFQGPFATVSIGLGG